jgi:hypothetical protein
MICLGSRAPVTESPFVKVSLEQSSRAVLVEETPQLARTGHHGYVDESEQPMHSSDSIAFQVVTLDEQTIGGWWECNF